MDFRLARASWGLPLLLLTVGCGFRANPGLILANTTAASSAVYTGAAFATSPVFAPLSPGSASPRASATGTVSLAPYLDASCGSAATGTFGVAQNPVAISQGYAAFGTMSYTLPTQFEQSLYFKATSAELLISMCSVKSDVLHHFVTGRGYAVFTPLDGLAKIFERDAQGRFVAGGFVVSSTGKSEFAIWRYFPNGELDTSFGSGLGYAVFQHNGNGVAGATNAAKDDLLTGMQLDSAGRIVTTGWSVNAAGSYELVVLRYLATGALDTSFGAGAGYVIFQHNGVGAAGGVNGSSKGDWPWEMIIDDQGRYLLVGASYNAAGGLAMAVWRYNSDGSLDTTFGGGTGYAIYQANGAGAAGEVSTAKNDEGYSIKIDAQGRLWIGGGSNGAGVGREATIWRYLSNGTLDTSFGGGAGFVLFQHGGLGAGGASNANKTDLISTLQIDSQGRVVTTGTVLSAIGSQQIAVWRYLSSGALDPSFGGGAGYVLLQNTFGGATGAAKYEVSGNIRLDSQERMVIAGSSRNTAGGTELLLLRLSADGSLDPSFGSGGYTTFQHDGLGAGGASNATKLDEGVRFVFDAQGRIVIPGRSRDGSGNYKPAFWRYRTSGQIDD